MAVGEFERALVFTLLKQAQRLIHDRRASLAAAAGQITFQKASGGRVDRDSDFLRQFRAAPSVAVISKQELCSESSKKVGFLYDKTLNKLLPDGSTMQRSGM